ncbi:MAG: hypothetical protein K0B81_09100 [Candidatus Cloacimonetes bacterium]|nr:hypothetical protein [Candidatus Cloacimonadota bacterium]
MSYVLRKNLRKGKNSDQEKPADGRASPLGAEQATSTDVHRLKRMDTDQRVERWNGDKVTR